MTENAELREAAEEILRTVNNGRVEIKVGMSFVMSSARLARHYLTTLREDDGEQVTEEWLRTLKADERTCPIDESPQFVWDNEAGVERLKLERYDEWCWTADVGESPWPDDIYVRSQVRDLMKALSIPLQEQADAR